MKDITLVHQDDAFIVVSKPHDLLSVPGRGPEKQDCLIRRVQAQFPTARIVHRLDCATSGLMVLALNADSHRELSRQFHDREVEKDYIALVHGCPADLSGEVNLPLMTDWPNRPRQMISDQGKHALTRYRVLSQQDGVARVALFPVTGRTHQLRMHMLALGCPILGDRLYAPEDVIKASQRLMLHALSLQFSHPVSSQRMAFSPAAPF